MTKQVKMTEFQIQQYNKVALKKARLADMNKEISDQEDQFLKLILDFQGITDLPVHTKVLDGGILEFTFLDNK